MVKEGVTNNDQSLVLMGTSPISSHWRNEMTNYNLVPNEKISSITIFSVDTQGLSLVATYD